MKSQDGRSVRQYTQQTIKLLWGRSAGRCAIPECRANLISDATHYDPVVAIGDIAHVVAASPRGPRGRGHGGRPPASNHYDNLILLCPSCHRKLDRQPGSHTVEQLRGIKKAHEDWVKMSLPERNQSAKAWRVVVLRGQQPIDLGACTEALAPDYPNTKILTLTARPEHGWSKIALEFRRNVQRLFAGRDPYGSRFAVFPLAPTSACIALGYFLTSRPAVRLFQYHRVAQSWRWPAVRARRLPGLAIDFGRSGGMPDHVAFMFQLSAHIDYAQVRALLPRGTKFVSIYVEHPSTDWLRHKQQLQSLGETARQAFEEALARWPMARTWDIFFAGPAPGGVVVGQQLNPTMSPLVQLYEFRHPHHQRSIAIESLD